MFLCFTSHTVPQTCGEGWDTIAKHICFEFQMQIVAISLSPPQPELQMHCTSNGDMQVRYATTFFLIYTWNSHNYVTKTVNYLGSTVQESYE